MVTVGIDEVGRGCWAGPLVAGAVILPEPLLLSDECQLRDSKKLSAKQREKAAVWLDAHATAIGLGWVTSAEIDKLGLTESVRLAYVRALEGIAAEYDEIIIDGNINYLSDNPKARAIVKADDSVPCVSAASIAAKVARDAYMTKISSTYTGYGFELHVGYGTAAHLAALKKYGPTDIHRLSYRPIKALGL